MTALRHVTCVLLPLVLATSASAQTPPTPDRDKGSQPVTGSGWTGEVDPLYVWIPFFSASADVPELPDAPSPPGGASANTTAWLNGALLVGFRLQNGRFETRANLLYAGLSASRETPSLHVTLDVAYLELFGGWAVAQNLQLEGGVRRISADTTAQLLSYPTMSAKPGLWDPLVGMTYRRPIGRKWRLTLHGDAGGFGVGSDVDLSFSGGLDWRAASHFGMAFGYQAGYLRFSHPVLESTSLDKELTIGATLQGPTLAVRILF